MVAPIVDFKATVDTVLYEGGYTVGKLQSHSLAKTFTPQCDAFQATCQATFADRTALVILVAKAEGRASGADDDCDDFLDTLDRTALIVCKNDRKAALYVLLFPKPVNELKRPVLGPELATLKKILKTLQDPAMHPALAALAPQLVIILAAADAAVDDRDAAIQALKDFDAVGGKKTLIADFNALRQNLFGQLAAIPFQHPNAMLPATFADRFFHHTSHKGSGGPNNLTEAQADVDKLKKQLAEAENKVKEFMDAAQAQADADAALATAEKVAADADADEKKAKAAKKKADEAAKAAKKLAKKKKK